ncbi:MAG: LD-carboxypeptidase [Deltaproteobacteria bacterium]|nr:LD-carboxypeptidase [Deltaproteobacteria bacterium]
MVVVGPAMVRPPALHPGDRVIAVAPSGPFEPNLGWLGLGWLSRRYKVEFRRDVFTVAGYLAGDAARRGRELVAAIADPNARAVIAMRGGYGLHHVAHLPDWEAFSRDPKWIVGFSDVTVLHVEAARVGVMSMHAPMVALLGRGCEADRARWLDALEAPERIRTWTGLGTLRQGRASGRLFGGNLTVLHACAAGGRLRVPSGAILLLEDVGERPYRIDRMLTTMLMGGHLASVAGVVLGEFTECNPGADGVCARDVLRGILGELGVPVIDGLCVGHGLRNEPIVLGANAQIDAEESSATLTVRA